MVNPHDRLSSSSWRLPYPMVILVDPGKSPKRRISNEIKPSEACKGEEEPYQLQPSRWQVVLVRAIVQGSLEDFVAEAIAHPEAIHLKFTRSMAQWELQWESVQWYEFLYCTATYIAACYARPDIVQWLIDNGADPNVPCYANLKPIDVIGQCRKCKEDQEKVRELLLRPLKVLKAPRTPSAVVKIHEEEIVVTEYELPPIQEGPRRSSANAAPAAQPIAKHIKKIETTARILLDWRCHWLPTEGDPVFEVRHRLFGNRDWKCERVKAALHHSILGLPLNTKYEIQVKAQNSVGWSEWSFAIIVSTAPPEQDQRSTSITK